MTDPAATSDARSVGGTPNPQAQTKPAPGLAPGHAFESFDLRTIEVPGADWAMEMEVTPQVVNSSGALQGGLLTTLVDLVAGTAIFRGGAVSQRGTTSELHVNFLAGARVGPVRATATILRRGQRTVVVRVDVHDRGADDLYVATATVTFAVRPTDGTGS
jgi:uncharacterized protein (TIGR00369 family)